jgi:predicted ester cyclase
MTRDEIAAFYAHRADAWKRLDSKALAADHAVDGTIESPNAGHVKGRALIEEIYRMWFAAFPDLEFRIDDLVIDGDHTVVVATILGTDSGGFMGLPPSGKRFKMTACLIATIGDHEIVHERRVYDFTGLLVQIGMLKARPA